MNSIKDFFTTTKTKKQSISKNLDNLSAKRIEELFSEKNLEKRENTEKLFSKDEQIKKKVKEEFENDLRARLNEDNQRYIKDDDLNKYYKAQMEKKVSEFDERLTKEIEKKEKQEREEEISRLNSRIGR